MNPLEVAKIEEPARTKQPTLIKLGCRECLYLEGKLCKLPQLMYKICKACPRASQYIKTNVVANLFAKIKGLAIMLMNMGAGGARK